MRLLLLPACAGVSLALLHPSLGLSFGAQQPQRPPQPPPEARPTPNDAELKSVQAKVDAMQGLWRLTELRTPKTPQTRREEVGYLLVSGMCFSLEMHWGWVGPDGRTFSNKDFQSGMHRFEMDDAGNMDTSSVIGSYFNQQGLLEWEQPGKTRRYKIVQHEKRMTWSNEEGISLTFEQMPEPRFVRRDVFGRPLPEKKKDGEKQDE